MKLVRLLLLVRGAFQDSVRLAASREGLKSLCGVYLCRNAIYLMLTSATMAFTGFWFWMGGSATLPGAGGGSGGFGGGSDLGPELSLRLPWVALGGGHAWLLSPWHSNHFHLRSQLTREG